MWQKLLIIGALLICLSHSINIKAERGDTPEYGQAGAYAVGTVELDIADDERPLHLTMWYPANAIAGEEPAVTYSLAYIFGVQGYAYRNAAPLSTEGAFPLVIYSHSSGASRVLSLWLTEHLASHGFIVMALDHPGNSISSIGLQEQDFAIGFAKRPRDISRLIDYATILNQDSEFQGLIDLERIGMVGYSAGAMTALELAGARLNFNQLTSFCDENSQAENFNVCRARDYAGAMAVARGYDSIPNGNWESMADERVDAIALFAPWNMPSMTFDEIQIPSLIVVGTDDEDAIPERDAFALYENLHTERYLASFALGGHALFVDECSPVVIRFARFETCTDSVWDLERAHDIINHLTTSFFMAQLMDNQEAQYSLANFESRGIDLAIRDGSPDDLLNEVPLIKQFR